MKQKKRGKHVQATKKAQHVPVSRIFLTVIPVIFLILSVVFGVMWIINQQHANLSQNGLPAIDITLHDTTLEEIKAGTKDEKYFDNTVTIYTTDGYEEYTKVRLKGRGNSTWGTDKRPFQIKFSSGVDLFGLGKTKKWALIANVSDASQLRNDAAFYLAKMLNMDYVSMGAFAELYIDTDYQGLYYLIHQVEIGNNQVDLREPTGVLVEVDNLHWRYDDETECFYTGEGMCLIMADVVDKNLGEVAMNGFIDDYNLLETAARDRNWAVIQKLIDVESFAKFFLLNEFTVDPDAYTSSWYMYKKDISDKIHAGPAWDFDFALGNRQWVGETSDADFYRPDNDMVREIEAMGSKTLPDGQVVSGQTNPTVSKLFYYLMTIPEFRAEVEKEYQERLSGKGTELIQYLAWQANYIKPALARDNAKWGISGYGNFEDETEYLLDWVQARFRHFEDTYGRNRQHPLVLT